MRSVAHAIDKTPLGGTVVLRAGTYHESMDITKKVTIQNYPGETVWFDGSSQVGGWSKSGSVWVAPWSTFFSPQNYTGGVRSNFPNANRPAQVFIGGAALAEVASAAEVRSGTFFPDAANRRLIIGTDPSGREVRASDLTHAMHISGDVTLRGFGVRRYATTQSSRGAVVMDPAGGTFEHLVVSDNASIGLALSGANKTIKNVVVERNGMIGLGMNEAAGVSITNSIFRDNNFETFPTLPQAAAIKITKTSGGVIRNNTIEGTKLANGLWLDGFNSDITIAGNDLANNGESQINFEISRRGTIVNNRIKGGLKSIDLLDSESVDIYNNKISDYTLIGIYMPQDDRSVNRPADAPADFALKIRNITIANNVMACGTRFQLFGRDLSTGRPVDDFALTIKGNLFSASSSSPELNLAGWGLANNGFQFLKTLGDLTAKNSSWINLQHNGCVVNPETTTDRAKQISVAVPLPTAIASAAGVPSGTRVIGLLDQPISNQAPTARFTSSTNGLSVSFNGSSSADADGIIVNHKWTFGDGTSGTGATPSHAYGAAGDYTVTLTVTDNAGGTHSVTAPVRVSAPSAPAPAPVTPVDGSTDDFSRTVSGGWGGDWAVSGGNTSFGVSSGQGTVILSPQSNREALLPYKSTDSTAQTMVSLDKLPTGTGVSTTVIGRRVGASYYGARFRVAPDGSTLLYALRDETALADAARPFARYAPGQQVWVKVDVSGTAPTAVRVKAWLVGSPEPTNWQISASDSAAGLQTAGQVGIKTHYGSSAASTVTVRVDDFTVS
ncbi:PKD domain-containing protein [Propioniciclava soli]|uniref:PKD domain-containing protein n=1 Tax=Propioniciclava soli TaxID=2775081 RepID=A0ABZ3C896_9ACTN